jgi:hypothetical protein
LNTDDDYRLKGIPKSTDNDTNTKKGKGTKKSAEKKKELVKEES